MDNSMQAADRLNDLLDARTLRTQAGDHRKLSDADLRALAMLDRATPEPEPLFLARLRDQLTGDPPALQTDKRGRGALGIVAQPIAIGLADYRWSKRAVIFTLAAVLAIAILTTGLTLRAGGHPAIGLATAQASAIGETPTPAIDTTYSVESMSR
jgi:hypothetical protein